MVNEASNHDEGFVLPSAPTIAPEFAHEWLELEHPEMASVVERFSWLANTTSLPRKITSCCSSRTRSAPILGIIQSRRSSMSSAAASIEGGDDARIAPIPGARVQEAFDELRAGELRRILEALHDPFVTVNNKKLYVQRTINASTDARTFIEHVTQVIKEKQANPEGQEA
ncbi:hypothetical protein NCS52_00226200 [Fusarium sp. LHS14.1]|nr:hypothetical protein NCS52_00226200 [Fusarium sp. LHS14.1]